MLCDFGQKSDFIYRKLLINSIKVKNMGQLEDLENCFRMTVPPLEGAKFLIETLKPRNLLIFDMDGVLFDVRNSYRCAIEKTFEHFAYKKLQDNEIQDAKNLGGLNCDWDLTEFLLKKHGIKIEKEKIIEIFQKYFFNPKNKDSKGLIDNEKLLIDKINIAKLAQKYELAVFTGRPKDEANYSLEKFGILKYFNIVVTKDDLPKNRQKPYPNGMDAIKRSSIFKEAFYFGDTGDDMLCAKAASVSAVGVLPPQESQNSKYKKHLMDKGALWVLNNINDILKEEK
jgi:HAD superfamily phosphatase